MSIKRKPKHVQRAREILKLEYQDQLAIIGELIAENEETYKNGYDKGYYDARVSAIRYPEKESGH